MSKRIFFDVCMIVVTFLLPPWLALIVGIAGLFLFDRFYEILLVGFVIDMLFGVPLPFFPLPLLYTICSFLFFCVATILKERLKFY